MVSWFESRFMRSEATHLEVNEKQNLVPCPCNSLFPFDSGKYILTIMVCDHTIIIHASL